MADIENDSFPSKRIRLSPEREDNILNTTTERVNTKQDPGVDGETFPTNFSAFQTSNVDPSEQDGGSSDVPHHEQFEEDDFPSCYSVEDDIDNNEEHHYQPIAGPMGWIQRQMNLGISPREILSYMIPHAKIPSDLKDDHVTLWKIIIDLLTSPSPRQKLDHVNYLDDVVSLINGCKNVVVLTGAGVSVSCGIPDFRSRDGIYARLSEEYPDLPDPQAMFDITYFNQNPYPFFKFAKEIYPGQFKPSLSHQFIHQIEKHGSLLRNYSQNIDTLEQIAGIENVIQCHGSFSTASCTNCKYKVSSPDIKGDIFNQKIPLCTKCKSEDGKLSIMKPDIVFFGESLPSDFYRHLEDDSEKADLLIVIGSSLKVRPVALIPSRIGSDVPQILINREPLRHMTFDVELLGDCDVIVAELCKRLGGTWTEILDGVESCPVERSCYPAMNSDDGTLGDSTVTRGTVDVEVKNPQELLEEQPIPVRESTTDTPPEQNQTTQEPHSSTQTLSPIQDTQTDTQTDAKQETESQSCSKRPLSSVSQNVQTKTQGNGTVTVQSIGQDTSSMSTDEQRKELLVPSDVALATEQLSNQDSTSHNKEDPPMYIYHPPSRYIFFGAEITNSPVHSPFGSPLPSEDGNSDNCSDNDSLSKDDCDCSNVEGNGYSSSGDGSEGYGSGVMSTTDLTNNDMNLITGALGSYHCVSEDNSVMSGLDLVSDSTSSNAQQTSQDLLHVSNVLEENYVPQSAGSLINDDSNRTESLDLSLKDASHSDNTQEFF